MKTYKRWAIVGTPEWEIALFWQLYRDKCRIAYSNARSARIAVALWVLVREIRTLMGVHWWIKPSAVEIEHKYGRLVVRAGPLEAIHHSEAVEICDLEKALVVLRDNTTGWLMLSPMIEAPTYSPPVDLRNSPIRVIYTNTDDIHQAVFGLLDENGDVVTVVSPALFLAHAF